MNQPFFPCVSLEVAFPAGRDERDCVTRISAGAPSPCPLPRGRGRIYLGASPPILPSLREAGCFRAFVAKSLPPWGRWQPAGLTKEVCLPFGGRWPAGRMRVDCAKVVLAYAGALSPYPLPQGRGIVYFGASPQIRTSLREAARLRRQPPFPKAFPRREGGSPQGWRKRFAFPRGRWPKAG